ncbi:hypothetical protein ACPC54_40015 [Kitasatospora sp. NPDC094028]
MNDSPTVGATVRLVEPDGSAGPVLAHGFLTGPSTVLVPDPPETLGDPWRRYLVEIGPNGSGDGSAPEAVRVAGISLAATSAEGVRVAAAVLALVGPSRHADLAAVRTTLPALTDSLRRHQGDLWSAYAALGFAVAAPAEPAPAEPAPAEPAPAEPAASGQSADQSADAWWIGQAGHDLVVFAQGICCISVNCGGCK